MQNITAFCFAALALLRLPALLLAPTLPLRLQVAGLCLGAFLCLLRQSLFSRRQSNHHGSAGFAASEDIALFLVENETRLAPGSVLLGTASGSGKPLALPLAMARQHGIIVGGSGTGKSWSFFLPNAVFARDTSLVASDPKSELWRQTSGYHAQATRYAPTDPEQSACFNWIPLCKDARLAELCARAIVEGSGGTEKQEAPWPDLESAFLAALWAYTATLPVPTPASAYQLFTRQEPARLMELFLNSDSPVAREQAIIFGQTHERMRGSIVPVVAAKLQFLRDPAVARFCSASFAPPNFGRLRTIPEALFWCVREQDIARLRPLSSLFYTLLFEQLAAETIREEETGTPVLCLLDEFANIGVVPNYDAVISLSRGRGVALWHGVQSIAQLELRYGKASSQTILTNCATKIALHGLDVETAEYFSKTLGAKTQTAPRRSWQGKRFALFASGVSDSLGEHARPLLTADEVRRIPTNQALVVTGNQRPLLLTKYRHQHPACAAPVCALGPALCEPVVAPAPHVPPARSAPPPFPEELRAPQPGNKDTRSKAWQAGPVRSRNTTVAISPVVSAQQKATSRTDEPNGSTLTSRLNNPSPVMRPWQVE